MSRAALVPPILWQGPYRARVALNMGLVTGQEYKSAHTHHCHDFKVRHFVTRAIHEDSSAGAGFQSVTNKIPFL